MKTLLLAVIMMSFPVFSQVQDWERFNSSLLIEVTRPTGVFTCSGVAVSQEVLVTAAHCLAGEVNRVRIFTQAKYDPRLTSLEIRDFYLHPNYNPERSRFKNDLAKIILKGKLPRSIRPYPIYPSKKITGTIYRFGYGGRGNQNVRTVVTPGLRRLNGEDEVLELYDEYSMQGDSGGPVFMETGGDVWLLAIHSTYSYGPLGNFSLNPLLSPHDTWIFSN